jgi:probable rRNA maturation factor
MPQLELSRTIRSNFPKVNFNKALKIAVPRNYSLSLVLTGDFLIKRLNSKYRRKNKTTNVLAFPISKTEGEIFINVRLAQKEANIQKIRTKDRILYLFIHACLHLNGYSHGKKMENKEIDILDKLKINHIKFK